MTKNQFSVLLAGIFFPCLSQSFEYFIDPRFAANERYDTNITLQLDPRQDNWITTVSPGVDFGFRKENSEFKSNFTWNQLFYTNQSELDFDEQLLSANFKHTGEKINWLFSGYYNSRSSLNTEADASGILISQLRRQDINATPSVTYNFDESNSLSLEYGYSDVSFEKGQTAASFLTDYTYHSFSAVFSHLFTLKDRFSLIFSSSIYESPGRVFPSSGFIDPFTFRIQSFKSDQNTTNYTLQLGWQHYFSELFSASVTAGARYTESEDITSITVQDRFLFINQPAITSTTTTKSSGIGQVFNVNVQKSFEKGSVSFNAYQQLTPTSVGNQQQTFLGVTSNYSLSERWRAGLNANYSAYELPSQQQSNQSRTYYAIVPSLSWIWTPEVNLQLSYTYRQLSFDRENQAREGNIAFFQFNYQPLINRQVK